MLYVCFRDHDSTGYPKRTDLAIRALFGEIMHTSRGLYTQELEKRICRIATSALAMKSQLLEPVEESESSDPAVTALFPSERHPAVWTDIEDRSTMDIQVQENPIVFAFDEALALLENVPGIGVSKFRMLRSAFKNLSSSPSTKNLRLIAVFVDTSSKMNNFSPHLEDDPSMRQSECAFPERLFHPYILYGTSDLELKSCESDDLLSKVAESDGHLSAGRP
jgi:hypothetical protein